VHSLIYITKEFTQRFLKTWFQDTVFRILFRVGNFRQKNNSAEDGIDGTNGYFRRNSGCSADRKSRNSVPNPSAEEKTTRNSIPWNKNKSKLPLFCSEPFAEENTTRNSIPWNQNRCQFSEFRSEPFRGREHNSEFRSVQQII
jgi:hypothetical protein